MKLEIPISRPLGGAAAGTRKLPVRQIAMLLAAGLLSVLAGYLGFQRFAATAPAPPALQTAVARPGSLVSTTTATGSVVLTRTAKLGFTTAGKLVELNVAVGARVKAGQLLAKLDTQPLQAKLVSAESALKVSQINLQQLRAGATPEELEAARLSYDLAQARYKEIAAGATVSERQASESAVEQAASNLTAAQAKLDQLKAGPTRSELSSAEGAVQTAWTNLASAGLKLDQLKAGATAAELASAQATVESARSGLVTAQDKLDLLQKGPTAAELATARGKVEQTKGSLISAQDRYKNASEGRLSDTERVSMASVEQSLIAAQLSHQAAVDDLAKLREGATAAELQAAQSAVTSAQANYSSAIAKLDQVKQGPTATDLAAAEGGVEQARISLANAQTKLTELQAGPTESDLIAAQNSVEQARSSLASARTKLAELMAGPKDSDLISARSSLASAQVQLNTKMTVKEADLLQQQEQVRQAESTLQQARLDLEAATIQAPFDGVVSAIGANAGEQVASTTTAVVTVVDPGAFRIDVTVDESDVARLAAGQTASISFDALPDQRLQGKVISVPPSGTTQQGVVTYLVSIGVENPSRAFPAGMSASASIETERKENVLLVPNRAVRTQGRNRVVEVMVGETTEMRQVRVGSANDQFTEIVSGLQEGDTVVIPVTTTSQPRTNFGGVPQPAVKVVR